jgi:hypothetical protein
LPRVKTQHLSGSGGGGSLSSVVHFFKAPLWTPPSSLSLSSGGSVSAVAGEFCFGVGSSLDRV